MFNQHRIWTLFFTLVLGLALAACGGEGEPALPADAQAAPTEVPADVAPTPVVPTRTPALTADDHVERGIELADQGALDEAIVEFQAALDLDPDHVAAHGNLGAAYGRQDDIARALVELERAIELDPNYAKAHANLCHLYDVQGERDKALAACETALELDPNDSLAHTNMAVLYLEVQDYDQAIDELTRAIELDPEDKLALNDLGYAYTATDDLDTAISVLQEALRIDPEFTDAMLNLGVAYAHMGDVASAAAQYQEALRLRPDYADAHLNLGIVYRTLGQVSDAATEFETFAALQPDSPKAQPAKAEAARLRQIDASLTGEYRSSFGDFQVRYPSGWEPLEDDSGGVMFSPDSSAALFFAVWPVTLVDHGQGRDLSGVTTSEELMASAASFYDVDPEQMSAFPLAGQTAFVGDWEPVIGSTQRVGKIAFLVHDGLGYVIANAALPDQWDDYEMTGLAMVGSIAFVAPDLGAEYTRGTYSLHYPTGWFCDEKEALTTFTPLEGQYPQEAPYVAVIAGEENIAESFQLEGAVNEDTMRAAFIKMLDAEAGASVDRTAGDQSAVEFDFEAVQEGVPIAGTLVMMLQAPEPIVVLGAAPASRWEGFKGTFDAMMATVTTSGAVSSGATGGASDVDMTNPGSVLQAVFDAAQTQDFDSLAGLCDPMGQNDDDTAAICAVTADHPSRDTFVAYFAAGKVTGDAVISGDRAEVPFVFGPEGEEPEMMVLVQRDGKWYLSEF